MPPMNVKTIRLVPTGTKVLARKGGYEITLEGLRKNQNDKYEHFNIVFDCADIHQLLCFQGKADTAVRDHMHEVVESHNRFLKE